MMDDLFIDLKQFKRNTLVKQDDMSKTCIITETMSEKTFLAKVINISSDEFLTKISKEFLYDLKTINNSCPQLFIEFIGISLTDFNNEKHPVLVTMKPPEQSLEQIILEGNSYKSLDLTDKLINIYGIASAFLYLKSFNVIHSNLRVENVYETSDFHPKINLFDFEMPNSQQNFDFIKYDDHKIPTIKSDIFLFGLIAFSTITGERIKTIDQQQMIIKQVQDGFLKCNENTIPDRIKELVFDCLSIDSSSRITFEKIVHQLENDKKITEKDVNEKAYYSYIEFIKQETEEEKEDDDNKYSINVQPFDANNFNIKEEIGSGGSVCKLEHKQSKSIFAGKICLNKKVDKQSAAYLIREISILSQVSHQSIVKFLGYSSENVNDSDQVIILTELVPNGTLGSLIQLLSEGIDVKFWNDTMKLINIYGIASAMSYLHSNKIIHRDLKPQNILLDNFLFPKICDFGFSKFVTNKNTEAVGSLGYMAPEIFDSEFYTNKADVYSFGILINEILSSEKLNNSIKRSTWHYNKVLKGERPFIKDSIPLVYKELIEKCWHQDPSKRPSFKEIVEQLKMNKDFITKNVNEKRYELYIEYVEQRQPLICTIFPEYSLEPIYSDYAKLLESKDPIKENVPTIDLKKYKKIETIGHGGFGEVFTILDKETGEILAAKKLSLITNDAQDLKKQIQFRREVNILAEMKLINQFPNIINFIGFSPIDFEGNKCPIIVTEYYENGSLEGLLDMEREKYDMPFWDQTMKLINIFGIATAMLFYIQIIFYIVI